MFFTFICTSFSDLAGVHQLTVFSNTDVSPSIVKLTEACSQGHDESTLAEVTCTHD